MYRDWKRLSWAGLGDPCSQQGLDLEEAASKRLLDGLEGSVPHSGDVDVQFYSGHSCGKSLGSVGDAPALVAGLFQLGSVLAWEKYSWAEG